jgi:polar amino acid transport system substrate-binding protein
MKLPLFILTLIPLLSLIPPGSSLSAQDHPPVLKMVFDEWPPYTSTKVPNSGFACEVASLLFERLGYHVELLDTPTTDSEKGLEEGRYDIHPASWKTPEREKFLAYSKPYASNQLVIITSIRSLRPPGTLEELAGKRVGLAKGYGYSDSIGKNTSFTPVWATDLSASLGQLKRGEVDAVIGDKFVAQFISVSQINEAPGELQFSKPLEEKQLHVVVSRKRPDAEALVQIVNEQLEIMTQDGLIAQILKKHGMR